MKLTRDELLDIFATIYAEEVCDFAEAMKITPLQETALVFLMARIFDKIEQKIFK